MMRPLDPALAAIAQHVAEGGQSLFDLPPADARNIFDEMAAAGPRVHRVGVTAEDTTFSSSAGNIGLRIYQPASKHTDLTIVFVHGGGYMLGGLDQMQGEAEFLTEASGSVVVAVDYRLAPEYPLPAAHDDVVAAVEWAQANARRLGGNPNRVTLIGESAGANLAASAAIALRDIGTPVAGTALFVPAPDFAGLLAIEPNREYPMLSVEDLRAIARTCLPNTPGAASQYPYSAVYAPTLAGFPPTVIGLAGHCPTLSVGQAFAERLAEAGNRVEVRIFEDMFHPFLAFTAVSEAAKHAAEALVADFLAIVVDERSA